MDNKKRHAYLILAHNNAEQLNQLIELLENDRNDIYVHIDKKSTLDVSNVKKRADNHSLFVFKEIKIYWADFSQVEAELFLLKKAVSNGPYQYYHLLSGADLPIKKQSDILAFFDMHNGKEFVEYQIDGKFVDKPYYDRIKYYHVFAKHYRSGNAFKDNFFVGLEYFLIFWQWIFRVNRIPKNMVWARGSNWFDITDELAKYVLSKEEWISTQFRMTRSADESFLPLLVHNSEFKNRLFIQTFDGDMHANMRFIDWNRGDPYVFQDNDFDELMESDLLFARKFDEKRFPKIINRIIASIKESANVEK